MFKRRPRDPQDLRHESRGQSLLHPGPDVVPVKRDWVARAVLIMALVLLGFSVFGVWLRFRPIPYDPVTWQQSTGFDRGRMLKSLMSQTDFVGLTRTDIEHYLGREDFDERQFWYDLGPTTAPLVPEPRAWVGDSTHLNLVFSYDGVESITEILYNYRRPTLGSLPFDSTIWLGPDRSARRNVLTRVLGRLRAIGLRRSSVQVFLGPPDGARVRSHYDVGLAGAFIGSIKALVLEYDASDRVVRAQVVD